MEYRGIDVSKYQGDINFKKVKDDGIEFVIIRIGYGQYESQNKDAFKIPNPLPGIRQAFTHRC